MNALDVHAALPIMVMAFGSLVLLLCGLFTSDERTFPRLFWAVGVCIGAWVFALRFLRSGGVAFDGQMAGDPFSFVLYTIILGGTIVTFFLQSDSLKAQRVPTTIDVDVLVLLAATGGMVMVSACNMLVLFLGFELLSVCVYVLTGLARDERASTEGALKYFVLGAFSSAFLLYGMMLVYAATGSMELHTIAQRADADNLMLLLGLGLMMFGFGFKVSLVPFHFWAPDVYQGAPVSMTAFMAVVVKAAAFGAFLRMLLTAFGDMSAAWEGFIWIVALLTMTVGNIVALRQQSMKRMLAYSSVAHAGYALMGFLALGAHGGGEALIFYLWTYGIMTLAAFGVVMVVTAGTDAQYDRDDIDSFQGLGWEHPFLGLIMTLAMLSLAGIPPLAGFMGKFYLFAAAVRADFVGLVIIAALNSVVSLYYYLRVITVMFFTGERRLEWSPPTKLLFGPRIALAVVAIGIVLVGLFPTRYLAAAQTAIQSL